MDQPDTLENSQGSVAINRDRSRAHIDIPRPLEIPPNEASPSPLPEGGCSPMGAALAPVLVEICGRRLSSPRWFRTDWQRGGALTGYATWQGEDGSPREVVVKLPIPPIERRWLVQLSSDEITPRVYAHGSELGGYDLAWVVMERLGHGPISRNSGANGITALCEAAARFYARSAIVPIGKPPSPKDWHAQLKQSRDHIAKTRFKKPEAQRWRKALKKSGKLLDGWLDEWRARDMTTWCHGDLHLGNAMMRSAGSDSPAVLFDLASVHPGHWVEDAVYFEYLYWGNPSGLHGQKPVKLLAQQLKQYNCSPGNDWPRLAQIYRALLAISVPGRHSAKGGSAATAAALDVLERAV